MSLTFLIIGIVFYFGVTALLGYLGYRQTKNKSDYLVAGRKAHPVVIAISYGATFISTSAIVGFGGAAAVWHGALADGAQYLRRHLHRVYSIRQADASPGLALDAHTFPELMSNAMTRARLADRGRYPDIWRCRCMPARSLSAARNSSLRPWDVLTISHCSFRAGSISVRYLRWT